MLCCGSDIIKRLLLITGPVVFAPFWAWSMEEVNYRAIAEVLFCSLVHLSLPESASAGLNHQLCPVPGHETCGELV